MQNHRSHVLTDPNAHYHGTVDAIAHPAHSALFVPTIAEAAASGGFAIQGLAFRGNIANSRLPAHIHPPTPSLSLTANRTSGMGAQQCELPMSMNIVAFDQTRASALLPSAHIISPVQCNPLDRAALATDDTFQAPPAAPVAPRRATPPATLPASPQAFKEYRNLSKPLRSVLGGDADVIIKAETSSFAAPSLSSTVSQSVVRDFCADVALETTDQLLTHSASVLKALQTCFEQSDPEQLAQKVKYLEKRFYKHHASPFAPSFCENARAEATATQLREAVLLVLDMWCFLCELSMMTCDKERSMYYISAGHKLREKYDFVFNTPQYKQFIESAVFVANRMCLPKELMLRLLNERGKLHHAQGRA